jgi:hypothetical protein
VGGRGGSAVVGMCGCRGEMVLWRHGTEVCGHKVLKHIPLHIISLEHGLSNIISTLWLSVVRLANQFLLDNWNNQ